MRFGAGLSQPGFGRGVALTYTLTHLIAGHLIHLEICFHPNPPPPTSPHNPFFPFFSHSLSVKQCTYYVQSINAHSLGTSPQVSSGWPHTARVKNYLIIAAQAS